jgi:hypothetical protein
LDRQTLRSPPVGAALSTGRLGVNQPILPGRRCHLNRGASVTGLSAYPLGRRAIL